MNTEEVATCDRLVYSYSSSLSFWRITFDCFCAAVLGGSWALSGSLKRISGGVKGSITGFCCVKKVKGGGRIGVFNSSEIRLWISFLFFVFTSR